MTVRFSSDADEDLDAIGDFIARDNPTRARTFVREIVHAAATIPGTHLMYPALRSGRHDLRRKLHKGYLIIFRANEAEVEIVRILHGARDILRILDRERP